MKSATSIASVAYCTKCNRLNAQDLPSIILPYFPNQANVAIRDLVLFKLGCPTVSTSGPPPFPVCHTYTYDPFGHQLETCTTDSGWM